MDHGPKDYRDRWRRARQQMALRLAARPNDDRVTVKEKVRTEHFVRGRYVGYSEAPMTLPRVHWLERHQ